MTKVWTTADVHPRDRLAFWVDAVCDTFVRLDCASPPNCAFHGEIRSDGAGAVQVSTVVSTAQLVTRSPRQIARATDDYFLVSLQLSGRGRVSQDAREAELSVGDFALYDSTRPYRLSFDRPFEQLVLQMPRAALLRRIGGVEHLTAVRLDGSVGTAGIVSPMLRSFAAGIGSLPTAAGERVAENLLDLLATALLSSDAMNGRAMPASAALTLSRIKLYIEQHLASADLSAEAIARGCGLSVRHLNRLFEREDTSLMRHVWDRRLARCRRDLADPAMRRRPVGDIAFAAGFNDLSHFSRAFRRRYGSAPRDTRPAD
ncbi:MAG: helix-turn-helix domain-containing protein [Stellaceae bacterium]